MPRTILNETLLSRDAGVNTAAGGVYQTGDNVNGMYLGSVTVAGLNRKSGTLVLHIKNTNAAIRNLTVKAGSGGDQGPAFRATLGDLVVTVAATTGEQMLFLTDTARFKQVDGTINLDIDGVGTTIAALRKAGY